MDLLAYVLRVVSSARDYFRAPATLGSGVDDGDDDGSECGANTGNSLSVTLDEHDSETLGVIDGQISD